MKNRLIKIKSILCKITDEFIEAATPGHAGACVIARYLQSLGYNNVRVKDGHVKCNKDGIRYMYKLPAIARIFVADFDDGKPVKSLVFTLDAREATFAPILLAPQKGSNKPRKPTRSREERARCSDVRRNHPIVDYR